MPGNGAVALSESVYKICVQRENHFDECVHFLTDLFDLLTLIAMEFDEYDE